MSKLLRNGNNGRIQANLGRPAKRWDRRVEILRRGLVDSGSEWDGWHIRDVYLALLTMCQSRRAALDLTSSIWKNRVHALRQGGLDLEAVEKAAKRQQLRDKLDEALADVPAHELEPELPYFEDEVKI